MQKAIQSNRALTIGLTVVLWLVTAVVGLYEIGLSREILVGLFARFSNVSQAGYEAFKQEQLAGTLGIVLIMILAVVWIIAFIGGAEYLYRRVGQPSAWRLFAWIIGVELAIFILAWFL
jgi:hypothetical protein